MLKSYSPNLKFQVVWEVISEDKSAAQYLSEGGFMFVSIQPLKVRRFKDILGQPQKTGSYDAYVAADFLRTKEDQLINRPQFDSTVQEVKKLSRTYKDLKKQINRYTNQLDEVLGEYFPEFLGDSCSDASTFFLEDFYTLNPTVSIFA